ncbi:hypothetical protein BU24DRAFT_430534 [Aaosphaeria arxii CBS 175.79]|uniref:Aminoglycoside phosphotransferase domain-containing protein n=1 Tax=Aaosphaeria arxii CBS 175.79 TaxID=1450172 RepID=A0A6A5YA30_9PLEO|nr:uncharacterized protein BU24DRAFT_430534 [Aaosphaeria arxii CBS 175.79]KAF2022106.1 hypothetical protein BU24DRAFT_430534 [Aaosphaeria arxii CBS 175.79]
MDIDERIELVKKVQGELWEDRLNEAYRSGRLCAWASSFHHDRLPCELSDNTLLYGSDGTTWLLRLPRIGKVHDSYADEKVAVEVAAINLIRRDTTIPVPKIEAWGLAAQNPLGLGPFIIMESIQGRHLSDDEIETIYRQFASILLRLFKLDFDRIGSLDPPSPELRLPTRPLTWKVHDILQTGGIDITYTLLWHYLSFSSTTEYFKYVAEQDWKQLVQQPSSTYGQYDAMAKYRTFSILKSLIPDFFHSNFDRTKFKLICDDLGAANLMIRSRQDLTIIGIVDFEWSYIGPAQLFGSAPWWLLMDRPTDQAWDCYQGEPTKLLPVTLTEEEAKTPGHEENELSHLVHWSEHSGAMWLHMLLTTGFNDPCSFPLTKLIQHVGAGEWERRERELDEDEYNRDLQKIEEHSVLMAEGKIRKEDFVAMHSLF